MNTYYITIEVKSPFSRDLTRSLLDKVIEVGLSDAEETMKHDPNPVAEEVVALEVGSAV